MARILLVQSRITPARIARERDNFRRVLGTEATLEALSALDTEFEWNKPDISLRAYDGVIFGGSADFDFHGGRLERDPARVGATEILERTKHFIRYALEKKIPLLGVCFGHQLVAQMHGGRVENDPSQGKFGEHDVRLTSEGARDEIFGTFPQSFRAHYQHKDSVTTMPKSAVLLATGATCRFSALKYSDGAYTVQFHPELRCQSATCQKEHGLSEAAPVISRWIERVVRPKAKRS